MTRNDKREEILRFISHFSGTEETFTHGCCYWFAEILRQRFGGSVCYNPVPGHFATRIDERMYDVTGEIADEGFVRLFVLGMMDYPWYVRLIRNCRDFRD